MELWSINCTSEFALTWVRGAGFSISCTSKSGTQGHPGRAPSMYTSRTSLVTWKYLERGDTLFINWLNNGVVGGEESIASRYQKSSQQMLKGHIFWKNTAQKTNSILFSWIWIIYFNISKNHIRAESLLKKQRHLCRNLSYQMQVVVLWCVCMWLGGEYINTCHFLLKLLTLGNLS